MWDWIARPRCFFIRAIVGAGDGNEVTVKGIVLGRREAKLFTVRIQSCNDVILAGAFAKVNCWTPCEVLISTVRVFRYRRYHVIVLAGQRPRRSRSKASACSAAVWTEMLTLMAEEPENFAMFTLA